MTEIVDLSAAELRRLIGMKQVSPVEVMEASLARIAAVNHAVNAVVTLDAEAGLAGAKRAEDAVMAGEELDILHGLPVAVKDLEATAGMRTTQGSLLFEHDVPEDDDAMVANVKRAGGIVFAKTNTPEFGAGANTTNRVFGATGNPFNPVLTSAGSSGGSAVALATGMAPLATGSDMGGSLRTPAAFCGVVGFRPSPGMVPDAASKAALSPFPVLGPMGRCVEDAYLLLRAQLDVDARDPYSSPAALGFPERLAPADLSSIRAAFSTDLGTAPVDHGIRETFLKRTKTFGSVFRTAEWRHPDLPDLHETFEVLRAIGFVAAYATALATKRDLLNRFVIDGTERGLKYTMADVARAHARQTILYRNFLSFFDAVDVLICPAATVSPFPHAEPYVQEINGEKLATYTSWLALAYGPTMALATSCCIPCGLDHKGLPFGIQVIGPKGSDLTVLQVAHALEQVLASSPETARPVPDLAKLTMHRR
jgi:Asp-tRNA(Asn)/Glu-tRNA(Gln) amidotransferase A subunit family amidase